MIYVIVLDLAYLTVNLIFSLVKHPVYPPITFKDVMTYVYIAIVILMITFQYWISKIIYTKYKKSIDMELRSSI